jgi:hypothetical protein
VVSLLSGARTEEVRAIAWSHVVAYDRQVKTWLPVSEAGWDPHRAHSFVSLLSNHHIPIEDISGLVGHFNTVVT